VLSLSANGVMAASESGVHVTLTEPGLVLVESVYEVHVTS
jgi:hypothetical protein